MLHDPDFVKLVKEIRPHIKEISISEVYQKLHNEENLALIDVREDLEWFEERIPKSIHIGRGVLERDIANTIPDKTQQIILYCGGGFRSALAAYNLQKMGYKNVLSMDGGIRGWKEHNYPLDTTKGH